jgi:soluble lytic murein transglycosylase
MFLSTALYSTLFVMLAATGIVAQPRNGAESVPVSASGRPGALAPASMIPSLPVQTVSAPQDEPAAAPPMLKPPAAETAYRTKVRALLDPLLANDPSGDVVRSLKDAIGSRQLSVAESLADPIARKVATWQLMRAGLGEPADIVRFSAEHPAWPDSQLLQRRAEDQLFAKGGGSADIRAFFKGREPVSGTGYAALASAHLLEGDEEGARRLAVRAWTREDMPGSLEAGFLERFGKLLGPADHRHRVDRILIERPRFAAERRSQAAIARRAIALLPEQQKKIAEACLAAYLRSKSAAKLLAALPDDTGSPRDWGITFARVTEDLGKDRLAAAAKVLTNLPDDPLQLVNPDNWWLARREAAYKALRAGQSKLAYDLVKMSGPLSVNPLKEQSHMAGWIALRVLGKANLALPHFEAASKAADGPLSRARSAFWSGMALAALGRAEDAKASYRLAMRDADTFHGLLARQKIAGGSRTEMTITPPAMPTAEVARRFADMDAVRAAVLVQKAGLDRNMVIGLFAGLRNHLETEGELALLAELAASLGDTQTSLRVGKAAIARGHNLLLYAYPIDAFPEYEPLRTPPETAMLLAITRQETEFNTSIVSSAGARGLMQVMPITARHVCQQHKQTCDVPRLLTDKAYNARIASAYIGDRMAELGGWYPVALAAYNAGPGRARQWIRQNGDPRTPGVDSIDWMERIPIEETRHYVEKVLSNIQVYRARLGEPKALRLVEDLSSPSGTRR